MKLLLQIAGVPICMALSACTGGGVAGAPHADASICTVVAYDWSDGTSQGWTSSSTVSNPGGALAVHNDGNGSLQAFGPEAGDSLAETDVISFTAQIEEYSSVTSPSQLVKSQFSYNTPVPGDGSLEFTLDVSTLAFGQPHAFTFPVSGGMFTGTLTRAAFLAHTKFPSLMFADQAFSSNTSTATLRHFAVTSDQGCAP